MTALHQFGAEMLKLSRGLDAVSSIVAPMSANSSATCVASTNNKNNTNNNTELKKQHTPLLTNNHEMPPSKLTRERNRWVPLCFLSIHLYVTLCERYAFEHISNQIYLISLTLWIFKPAVNVCLYHKWHSDFISLGYLILFLIKWNAICFCALKLTFVALWG